MKDVITRPSLDAEQKSVEDIRAISADPACPHMYAMVESARPPGAEEENIKSRETVWRNVMRYMFSFIMIACVFTTCVHSEERFYELIRTQKLDIPDVQHFYQLHHLVQDGNTYLAILERIRKEGENITYENTIFRFSKNGRVLEEGQSFPGAFASPPELLEPVHDQSPPQNFPMLIPRERWSEECPYVLVTALSIHCLGPDLRFEKGHERFLPFHVRGVQVLQGKVWLQGFYKGAFAHRWNEKTGNIEEHRIPLKPILKRLQKEGFDEEYAMLKEKFTTLAQKDEHTEKKRKMLDLENEKDREKYLLETGIVAPAVQMNWIVSQKNVYLFFLKPMIMLRMDWFTQNIQTMHVFSQTDIPVNLRDIPWVYLVNISLVRGKPVVLFKMDRPLTLFRAREYFPESVVRDIEHRLQKKGNSNPNTIIGTEEFFVSMQPTSPFLDTFVFTTFKPRYDAFTFDSAPFLLSPTNNGGRKGGTGVVALLSDTRAPHRYYLGSFREASH